MAKRRRPTARTTTRLSGERCPLLAASPLLAAPLLSLLGAFLSFICFRLSCRRLLSLDKSRGPAQRVPCSAQLGALQSALAGGRGRRLLCQPLSAQ